MCCRTIRWRDNAIHERGDTPDISILGIGETILGGR